MTSSGDIARARVVLREQIREHVLVGEFEVLKIPAMSAGQLPAAHHQHNRLDEAALAIQPEDILIDSPVMQHGLALDGLLDRAHAVAHPRGIFEFEALSMRLHLLAHLAQQLEVLALQQHRRGVQMALVFVAIDRQAARPQASLDLIFDTRARAILEHRVGAGAQRKNLADDVDSLAQAVGRAERAEVLAAILARFCG